MIWKCNIVASGRRFKGVSQHLPETRLVIGRRPHGSPVTANLGIIHFASLWLELDGDEAVPEARKMAEQMCAEAISRALTHRLADGIRPRLQPIESRKSPFSGRAYPYGIYLVCAERLDRWMSN